MYGTFAARVTAASVGICWVIAKWIAHSTLSSLPSAHSSFAATRRPEWQRDNSEDRRMYDPFCNNPAYPNRRCGHLAPRPPAWRNPRKRRDQILLSGNLVSWATKPLWNPTNSIAAASAFVRGEVFGRRRQRLPVCSAQRSSGVCRLLGLIFAMLLCLFPRILYVALACKFG